MTLAEFQRQMAADVMRPLTASDGMALRAENGERVKDRVEGYVKPNDRLSSLERIEIYSHSYWYRLLDSLYEDFPGLRAIVGDAKFTRLSEAYLAECPSVSFTMRDLGSKLEGWLRNNPAWAGRNIEPAVDMVRLEWAHIEAFDGAFRREIGPEDLAEISAGLPVSLQPHVRLLDLHYPVDHLRIGVNAESEAHTTASNAVAEKRPRISRPKAGMLLKAAVFVAVHRSDGDVYYRRLEADEFAVLNAIGATGTKGASLGIVLGRALRAVTLPADVLQGKLQAWFSAWSQLGWLCHPAGKNRTKG